MTRKRIGCLAALFGTACLLGFASKLDAAKPEKLIRVTLESNEEFGVIPLECLGADVVNPGGRSNDMERTPKRMTFECLPGATVWLTERDNDSKHGGILTILPEDDGKTVHLRYGEHACYKNDALCTLDFTDAKNAKDIAKQLDILKQAKKDKKLDGLTVVLDLDDSSLLILQELKGSGAGLAIETKLDAKSLSNTLYQKRFRAISEVEPRLLEIDCRAIALVKGRLPKVETLFLLGTDFPSGDVISDLSKLARLRHLLLLVEKGTAAVDLKPLEELTQLKALTVFSMDQECKNADAIGSLAELQFLALLSKSPCDPSVFRRLSNLRYLAASFPADVDFSFAEKMPDLQTLCILNVEEKHNLKPLEKLPHLRCLALSQEPVGGGKKSFKAMSFKNVKDFEKARPDVDIVEYSGICLGSFWLLPLAAVAAVAAWLIRRRRVGKRLACQR